jgi:hypothetical protein
LISGDFYGTICAISTLEGMKDMLQNFALCLALALGLSLALSFCLLLGGQLNQTTSHGGYRYEKDAYVSYEAEVVGNFRFFFWEKEIAHSGKSRKSRRMRREESMMKRFKYLIQRCARRASPAAARI